jgi:hypothetical protein
VAAHHGIRGRAGLYRSSTNHGEGAIRVSAGLAKDLRDASLPPRHHRPAWVTGEVVKLKIIPATRDVVLVIAIGWFGASVMARGVLGWHRQAPDAPITVVDAVVLVFYLAWLLGSVAVMVGARRCGRSGWGWFVIAHTLSPLVAAAILSYVTRETESTTGAPAWSSPRGAVTHRLRPVALALGVLALIAIPGVWWWTRPAPETLTERLWRECHDTLSYTHPEWDERHLDRMTKACIDQRLLQSR